MTQIPFAVPKLSSFRLSDEEIAQALQVPITSKLRVGEIAISPDESAPRYPNRVLHAGIRYWEHYGDMPLAILIKRLLLMYFMGLLDGQSSQQGGYVMVQTAPAVAQSRQSVSFDDDWLADVEPDDDIRGDYDFNGIR